MDTYTELTAKIKDAELPTEIRKASLELLAASQELWPESQRRLKWLIWSQLQRVVNELIDPAAPVHAWEMSLDTLILEGEKLGESAANTILGAEQLRSLMRAYMGEYGSVSLEEITMQTVGIICDLSDTLRPPQNEMVAPNVYSLAQAHFNEFAWFRAIYAGKAPVGFLMIVDDDRTPRYFLWRLMIGNPYQGRGYGQEAIDRLVDYVRTRPGAKELGVSCMEGPGSPEEFYRKLGFVPTGEKIGEEIVLRLKL
jgi:diamine N-acetyltransferase